MLGSAKQSRRRDFEASPSTAHSGPGLNAMPAFKAGCTSRRTSISSGNFSHRKMPPFGTHGSTAVPNSRATASTIVLSLSCKVALSFST
ncbi:MAG TPA: hypothetical protein VG308_13995 [Stellaceae bacterium]|nr:hypothetical protein [Stellaceae bacterium]